MIIVSNIILVNKIIKNLINTNEWLGSYNKNKTGIFWKFQVGELYNRGIMVKFMVNSS